MQQQLNALNQIKTEISHTMRAFLNERGNIMQALESTPRTRERRSSNLVPSQFAPLALAVAAGVLISSSIVAVAVFALSRLTSP
jgi:hypothetical protein